MTSAQKWFWLPLLCSVAGLVMFAVLVLVGSFWVVGGVFIFVFGFCTLGYGLTEKNSSKVFDSFWKWMNSDS